MQVTLYSNFSKRENSTKQPTSIVGVTKDLKLKDSCSRIRPSFFIADVRDFTYLQAWGNYYFIRNSAFDINGAQYIDCELDYLATWKAQINNTRAFVKYSTSNYDENVIDDRIAQRVTNTSDYRIQPSIFDSSNRCVIVVTGLNGFFRVVAFPINTFKTFENALLSDSSSIVQELTEQFSNVSNAVLYARELPIPYTTFNQEPDIVFNFDSLSVTGKEIYINSSSTVGKLLRDTVTIDIPWLYSDFRRNRNFTKINMLLPFVGLVEVDPKIVIGHSQLDIDCVLNVINGAVTYKLQVNDTSGLYTIATFTGECGRLIPVTTNTHNAVGVINNAINMTAGLLSGDMTKSIAGVSSYLSNSVAMTVNAYRDNLSTIGGFGGSYSELGIGSSYMIFCIATDSRTDPSELTTLYGRPCFKVLRIGSLSGYVETSGFSIELDTYTDARDVINKLMDTGVYLE